MWVRRGSDAFSEDPDNNEDLVIQYLNDAGSWVTLETLPGNGTPGEIFDRTYTLPSNALHAALQIRVSQTGGNGSNFDYWHIDDVVLTETAAAPSLSYPFCDDFESGISNWNINASSGDAGIGSQTYNSAANSLYLRWGVVDVSSSDIDLSAVSTAYLSFWLRRGDDSFSEDPDNNEDFTVEYLNNLGSWVSLETFAGNGTSGEIFSRSYALPADAMHGGFKIRLSMTGGNGSDFDYWHVDDVCVGPPPSALAQYHLDESSWGAVTDSSGNSNDGSIVGGVVPDSASPVVATDPGTCSYADIPYNNAISTYDAIDTGIDVDGAIGNSGTIDFWYKSNARWNGNNGDRQLFDASTTASGQKYFFLTLKNNSRLSFGLEDSNDGDYVLEGGSNNFNAGVWVHVAVTWDLPNDKLQIYINGSLDNEQIFSTNGVLSNLDTLYLGDNRSTYQVTGMTGNSANGSLDEVKIYDYVLTQAEIQGDMNATHACGSTLDHFVVGHNGYGISCVLEAITVTAVQADGTTYTGYTGSIVLDTQSGNGSWTLNAGNGAFNDATADDGLASYVFDVADSGVAVFDLDYQSGTGSIDVDAYDGSIRDDDTEGNLVFTPSGFTVTATALSNPPPASINTTISAQKAATDFTLYLAAYGQTPTDPVCGIIESYTGPQSINFWSGYNNPSSGTIPLTVDGTNVATSEAASVVQGVTFSNGQAAINMNYPDVGQVTLHLKDITTTNPDLPVGGIGGASAAFVVKPAGFVLSNIQRSSDAFTNPGTATNETGSAFMAAGDLFSVTVTAINSLGNATPNYGQESVPESVLLTPSLVAAGAGNNPAIAFTTGFNGFVNGIDTGTDFHWDEVGIITLTPSIGDGNYLGGGDVSGTVSANVGRFYPDHFTTAFAAGSFANSCTTGTAFTYLGQSFGYLGNPTITATAQSAINTTTTNYAGAWAKLTTGGVNLTYPTADNSQLDEGGATAIALTAMPGALSRVDNADGSLTFTLGGASADSFAYDRSAGQVAPFSSNLTVQLTAVSDGEAVANDLTPAKDINPVGNLQRFGRGYAQDAHGTMSLVGDSLTVPVGVSYYDVGGVWTLNSDDSCSQYSYTKTDNDISTTAVATSPVTLVNGVGSLTLTVNADAGSPGGNSVIDTVWDSWLRYDIDAIDLPLDGDLYDDNPSASATFGIFRGDDRYLYWREAP